VKGYRPKVNFFEKTSASLKMQFQKQLMIKGGRDMDMSQGLSQKQMQKMMKKFGKMKKGRF